MKSSIFPISNENNNVAVTFTIDKEYFPYFLVALQSIIENSSQNIIYDILVFIPQIEEVEKKAALHLIEKYRNFSIRFFNPVPFIFDEKGISRIRISSNVYNINCCTKVFLPEILVNYDKVLFLDADIMVLDDIAEVYFLNLGDAALGAVVDVGNVFSYQMDDKWIVKHIRNVLKLENPEDYFNTGLLLMNLEKMRSLCVVENIIQLSRKINSVFPEQDLLNILFDGKYYHINIKWNYLVNVQQKPESGKWNEEYEVASEDPKLIHFAGKPRPWIEPSYTKETRQYWEYAQNAGIYELLIYRMVQASQKKKIHENIKWNERIKQWLALLYQYITLKNI